MTTGWLGSQDRKNHAAIAATAEPQVPGAGCSKPEPKPVASQKAGCVRRFFQLTGPELIKLGIIIT